MEPAQGGQGTENPADNAQSALPKYIGDYEVLKFIGRGKFAVVYRAKKVGDDQVVALKRISVDMMNEKAREKCLKEVRLLQSLDHPNIIRYMDSFITDNDLIIVYEWAAAGDLKRQLRKAQEKGVTFDERLVWKYFSQIANAMQHMHEKRIMHRDLKPANIFLTLEGVIKVGDLGLSRELSEHTIQAHSKVGTPLYMSPEVLKGDGYDFKSDVWSLGCLLYELAALKSPFKAEGLNYYTLFQKIANGEYQPLPDTYSEELRSLCYKMISTNPEDRPDIGYVCQVAAQMRQLTSERSGRLKRSNSNGSMTAPIAAAAAEGKDDLGDDPKASRPPSSRPNSSTLPVHGLNPAVIMPGSILCVRIIRCSNECVCVCGTAPEGKEEEMKGLDLDAYFQPPPRSTSDAQILPTHNPTSAPTSTSMYVPSLSNNANQDTPPTTAVDGSRAMYRRPKAMSGDHISTTTAATTAVSAGTGSRPRSKSASRPSSGIDRDAFSFVPTPASTALTTALENTSSSFALMETVYSKLHLVGYNPCNPRGIDLSHCPADQRTREVILPIHFAVNLQLFGQIGRLDSKHISRQFAQFVEIVRYCSEQLSSSVREAAAGWQVDRGDMPLTIAKAILRILPQVIEMNEELTGVTPTNLVPGFGYSVCLVLDAFLSAALAARHVTTQPTYRSAAEAEMVVGGHGGNEEEEEEVMEEEDLSVHGLAHEDGAVAEDLPDLSHTFAPALPFVESHPAISPEAWNLETERVAPVLIQRYKEALGDPLGNLWRQHVDHIVTYSLQSRPRKDQHPSSSSSSKSNSSSVLHHGDILEAVKRLRLAVHGELASISAQEKVVNLREAMARVSQEFASYQQQRQGLQSRISDSQVQISLLAGVSEALEEEIDLLQSTLQQRHHDTDIIGGSANPVVSPFFLCCLS